MKYKYKKLGGELVMYSPPTMPTRIASQRIFEVNQEDKITLNEIIAWAEEEELDPLDISLKIYQSSVDFSSQEKDKDFNKRVSEYKEDLLSYSAWYEINKEEIISLEETKAAKEKAELIKKNKAKEAIILERIKGLENDLLKLRMV